MRASVADPRLMARLYQETRERIIALVTGLDDAAWRAAVAARPGWSVRDVVAHLTAVAEDWVSGRLTGAPTDEETAAQIARLSGYDVAETLAAWTAAAARLDHMAEIRLRTSRFEALGRLSGPPQPRPARRHGLVG